MNKYRNVETNGFHSKKESRRYDALRILERAGVIVDLQTQVKYDIVVNDVKICSYTADFVYLESGVKVVEDVKGYANDRWPMKKKLMRAVHGIVVKEV